MYIFDSVLKQKVKFEPIRKNEVSIYLCGPTVYDDAHLGHAKSSITFDLLRRTFIALGYKVNFIRNFTDIDDKILNKMAQTNCSLEEITQKYITSYNQDMNAIKILEPNKTPRATQCINSIINYIQKLIDKNLTYTIKDGIYFDTGKDKDYLSLSGRNDENNLARVKGNDDKKNEKDFVLWKFDDKWYDAPFGKGRPGWHTECVAMIKTYFDGSLDYQIDIHAGGIDLLFPHHENEAAQCRCLEQKELAKYWMHNGFIQINDEKMSKSLGNAFFIKNALQIVPAEALRYYLMSCHYRANFNYSVADLLASKKRLDKLYRLKKRLTNQKIGKANETFKMNLLEFMTDDLNVSKALSAIDEMINLANQTIDKEPKNNDFKQEIAGNLNFIKELLGIGYEDENSWFLWGLDEKMLKKIESLIQARANAKKQKNFALCDQIRDELKAMDIVIMDTANGTTWEKICAE